MLFLLASCLPPLPPVDTGTTAFDSGVGDADTDADSDTDADTDSAETGSAPDADGDGSPDEEDCDDADSHVNPGEQEQCSTYYDDNCDGNTNDADAVGCANYYPVYGSGVGYTCIDDVCLCEAPSAAYTTDPLESCYVACQGYSADGGGGPPPTSAHWDGGAITWSLDGGCLTNAHASVSDPDLVWTSDSLPIDVAYVASDSTLGLTAGSYWQAAVSPSAHGRVDYEVVTFTITSDQGTWLESVTFGP